MVKIKHNWGNRLSLEQNKFMRGIFANSQKKYDKNVSELDVK